MRRTGLADPWVAIFAATSVAMLGLLLVADRYVELLAASTAYAAAWVIARHEREHPNREEQR